MGNQEYKGSPIVGYAFALLAVVLVIVAAVAYGS